MIAKLLLHSAIKCDFSDSMQLEMFCKIPCQISFVIFQQFKSLLS